MVGSFRKPNVLFNWILRESGAELFFPARKLFDLSVVFGIKAKMPRLDFSIVPNVSAWEVNEKCILYVARVDHPLLDTVLKVDRNETEPLRPFYKSIPDLQPLCFAWKPVDLVSIEYQIFLETIPYVFEMLRSLVQGIELLFMHRRLPSRPSFTHLSNHTVSLPRTPIVVLSKLRFTFEPGLSS